MSRALNVLSIDFDFFQVVDANTILLHYPDGHDLPTILAEHVWHSRYNYGTDESKRALLNVGINKNALNRTFKLIRNNTTEDAKLFASNSHKRIYQFILDAINESAEEFSGVNIYNLDMHPDTRTINDELDCGNWVDYVIRDFNNCEVTWIYNPTSPELFDFDKLDNIIKRKTLRGLRNVDFDLVFMCRSDIWTPPHLDEYFDALLNNSIQYFESGSIEKGISFPRRFVIGS